MEQPTIENDAFHKPGPTCRRCKTKYVVHVWAVSFEVWTCYAKDALGRYCGTLNVWQRDKDPTPA